MGGGAGEVSEGAAQGGTAGAIREPSPCRLLAISGCSSHAASTTALPPTADIRSAMSAFAPIPSASPPAGDLLGGAARGPLVTQSGLSASTLHCYQLLLDSELEGRADLAGEIQEWLEGLGLGKYASHLGG